MEMYGRLDPTHPPIGAYVLNGRPLAIILVIGWTGNKLILKGGLCDTPLPGHELGTVFDLTLYIVKEYSEQNKTVIFPCHGLVVTFSLHLVPDLVLRMWPKARRPRRVPPFTFCNVTF